MKKAGILAILIFFALNSFSQLSEDLNKLQNVEILSIKKRQKFTNESNSSTLYLVGKQFFGFYKGFVSSQDANNCPFSPSCSVYMLESIEKKGFLSGFFNGMDRLMRCNGRDLDKYFFDFRSEHLIDPPVNNEKQ